MQLADTQAPAQSHEDLCRRTNLSAHSLCNNLADLESLSREVQTEHSIIQSGKLCYIKNKASSYRDLILAHRDYYNLVLFSHPGELGRPSIIIEDMNSLSNTSLMATLTKTQSGKCGSDGIACACCGSTDLLPIQKDSSHQEREIDTETEVKICSALEDNIKCACFSCDASEQVSATLR